MIPPRPYGYRTIDQHDIARLKSLLSITPRATVVSLDCYAVTFTVAHHCKDAAEWEMYLRDFGYDVTIRESFIIARARRAA